VLHALLLVAEHTALHQPNNPTRTEGLNMKTNGSKPAYNEMVEKWGDSHFFSVLMDTNWDPEQLCYTREMFCVKPAHTSSSTGEKFKEDFGCDTHFEAHMYLDPTYYNQYRSIIEDDNLHPTYPMYYVNNGKPRREHMFNSWDILEEDIQGQTAPFLPFHPPDFEYEKPKQDNFKSTGVLIPIIRTEWFVRNDDGGDEFVGVDYRAYSTESETREGMIKYEWDENLPLNLYKNYDDARLYLAPNHPLNWLRDGVTFLNR